MIEKSRLEELIKQGATIWSRYTDLIKKEPILIDLSSLNQENPRFKLYNDEHKIEIYDYDNLLMYQLEDLYETEKDAEWASKYQLIPRTEYLDLPTWEEFKNQDKPIRFCGDDWEVYELRLALDKSEIYLDEVGDYEMYGQDMWEATEENYIKACDLCIKLFKGEKV